MKKLLLLTLALSALSTECYKNFVLISAPGSGKGTFSQHMIEQHNFTQICPGDLFRSEIRNQTELGKLIQPVVERGDYVDEEIVCQVIAKYIEQATANNQPFIIDGFPRSVHSYNFLHNYLTQNNLVANTCFIQFNVADEVCVNRIGARQICPQCNHVYNVKTAQPKVENVCDECGASLGLRSADTVAIARKRLNYFHENVEPLLNLAKQSYDVITIQSNNELSSLLKKYDKLVD